MIKCCGFTAPEAIAWIRICRPGSIIGPQQQFLIRYAERVRSPSFDEDREELPRSPEPARPAPTEWVPPVRRGDVAGTPVAVRSRDGHGLRIQALSLTPPVPQPRKLARAKDNARITPRKI
jgi:cell division cycle 14